MKKIQLILLIIGISCKSIFAQDTLKSNEHKYRSAIGLSGINTFFKNREQYIANRDAIPDYSYGVGFNFKEDFNFHKNIGISTGIQYLLYRLRFDSFFGSYDSNTPMDYHHKLLIYEIQIPLTIKLINPYFYCFVGINYRCPVYATGKITNINGQVVVKGKADVRNFNSYAIGQEIIGMGKEFEGAKNKFFIEVQYKNANYGNALGYSGFPDKNRIPTNDIIIRNSMLFFTCGLYINNKKDKK